MFELRKLIDDNKLNAAFDELPNTLRFTKPPKPIMVDDIDISILFQRAFFIRTME